MTFDYHKDIVWCGKRDCKWCGNGEFGFCRAKEEISINKDGKCETYEVKS